MGIATIEVPAGGKPTVDLEPPEDCPAGPPTPAPASALELGEPELAKDADAELLKVLAFTTSRAGAFVVSALEAMEAETAEGSAEAATLTEVPASWPAGGHSVRVPPKKHAPEAFLVRGNGPLLDFCDTTDVFSTIASFVTTLVEGEVGAGDAAPTRVSTD